MYAVLLKIRHFSDLPYTFENIKMIEVKLSQGAKPGKGGILPKEKVTNEIANARGVQVGEDCISPNNHSAFKNTHEMIEFIENCWSQRAALCSQGPRVHRRPRETPDGARGLILSTSMADDKRAVTQRVMLDLVDQGFMFTALDVSNEVKNHVSARHREISPLVRELFDEGVLGDDYTRTLIDVLVTL